MSTKEFDPGPLGDARMEHGHLDRAHRGPRGQDEDWHGDGWTLIFVRQLRHSPASVWAALTDPAEVDQWAPFTADRDLGVRGDATLTMIDGDTRMEMPATVLRAEPPAVLEYTWGKDLLRWELEAVDSGTRLTLRHTLSEPDMRAMVAAGWHICFGVLDRLLAGDPVGAIRGRDALEYDWDRLRDGYAERFATD